MTSQDLEQTIEATRAGVLAVVNGDHRPFMAFYSRADDVSIGNPFGPFALGWGDTDRTIGSAAARYASGQILGVDRVSLHRSDTLACVVEVERLRVTMVGQEAPADVALRATTVYRLEDDGWRIVHRHADPITSPRTTESLLER
ncbi:MAG: nuclear transport factor 2 family protein [Acidimicrobiales bacterium]